jgi:ATP-dependent Clp protease adaptor protein ClpS
VAAIVATAEAFSAALGYTAPPFEAYLHALLAHEAGAAIFAAAGANVDKLMAELVRLLNGSSRELVIPARTYVELVGDIVRASGRDAITVGDLAAALMLARTSMIVEQLAQEGIERIDILNYVAHGIRKPRPFWSWRRWTELPRARLVNAKAPPRPRGDCRVIVHNDDYTTVKVVLGVLASRFHKTPDEAAELVKTVNTAGSATVGVFPARVANKLAYLATYDAHSAGFPLRFSVEAT